MRTIAKAMHADSKGEELVKLMDSRLVQVKQQVAALKLQQPKKIVLVSLMSSYGGKGCIFDDMCKEAGVINGVSAAGIKNGQQITKEMLVKIDPDLLIMPVYNDHGNFDIKKYNAGSAAFKGEVNSVRLKNCTNQHQIRCWLVQFLIFIRLNT